MSAQRWVLGVDGGNTKTIAVVAGADGRTAGVGRAGCSDIYGAGTSELAVEAIASATAAALAEAGVPAAAIDSAVLSLAGADWPEDFRFWETTLPARLGLTSAPLVVNDAIGALRSGSPDWTGMAIVSGTYSALGARHPDGRVFHLGFWPDGAGSRELADDALRAVYRAELELGPPTVLGERALDLYGAADAIALLHAFTRRGGLPDAEKSRFTPVLLDVAEAGDGVAAEIVRAKGQILGSQARTCAHRVGLAVEGARVVLTGGVFAHPTTLLADAALAELPGARPVRPDGQPVVGAVLLALDRLSVEVDAADIAAGMREGLSEGGGAAWEPSLSKA